MSKLIQLLELCEESHSLTSIYPSKMTYWLKFRLLQLWGVNFNFFNVHKKYLEEIKYRNKILKKLKLVGLPTLQK